MLKIRQVTSGKLPPAFRSRCQPGPGQVLNWGPHPMPQDISVLLLGCILIAGSLRMAHCTGL